MLAYVFWHWPRTGVPQDRYESLQQRFHAALRDAPPPGFLGSHLRFDQRRLMDQSECDGI